MGSSINRYEENQTFWQSLTIGALGDRLGKLPHVGPVYYKNELYYSLIHTVLHKV